MSSYFDNCLLFFKVLSSDFIFFIINILIVICFSFLIAVASHVECPVHTGTLYAYPDGDILDFKDNFDPVFQTNIDTVDE
jgi:hypothetical protein